MIFYGSEENGEPADITDLSVKIFEVDQGTSLPGAELYSQNVDVSSLIDYGWYRIILTTPLVAQADNLFVGIQTNHQFSFYITKRNELHYSMSFVRVKSTRITNEY